MKCFTGTIKGIDVSHDPRLSNIIALGEEGRGRKLAKVRISAGASPEIVQGKVHACDVYGMTECQYLLRREEREDGRALVRVITRGDYTRDTHGYAKAYWGQPRLIVGGNGAHGTAGRIGSWTDQLWIMPPKSSVFVKPEGGFKSFAYVLHYDGDGLITDWGCEDWREAHLADLRPTVGDLSLAVSRGHKKLAEAIRLIGPDCKILRDIER